MFGASPEYTIVCLLMNGLHSNAFESVFRSFGPAVVLHTRKYPGFALTDFDHDDTFALFREVSAAYVHRHIRLRSPADLRARWDLRADATRIVSEVVADRLTAGLSMVVIVNGCAEIDIFDGALRRSDADRRSAPSCRRTPTTSRPLVLARLPLKSVGCAEPPFLTRFFEVEADAHASRSGAADRPLGLSA